MFLLRKTLASETNLKKLLKIPDAKQNIPKVRISNDTFYRHKYSPELEAAVNKQIQAEQQAAQEYLNLAVSLMHPSVSRHGTGGFFMCMYHEELHHMEEFIRYQLHRGGVPVIQGVTAPTPKPNINLIEAFKQALNMEHCIAEQIEQLIAIADKDKDYNCVNFVTTIFLTEQMKAIHELSEHVTKISSIWDNPDALHQYDLQLHNTHQNIHVSK